MAFQTPTSALKAFRRSADLTQVHVRDNRAVVRAVESRDAPLAGLGVEALQLPLDRFVEDVAGGWGSGRYWYSTPNARTWRAGRCPPTAVDFLRHFAGERPLSLAPIRNAMVIDVDLPKFHMSQPESPNAGHGIAPT